MPDPTRPVSPPEDGTGETHKRCGFLLACPCWTAGVARAQDETGLDVERLSDVLAQHRMGTGQYAYLVTTPGWNGGHYADPREFAAVIAEHYAALSPTPTPAERTGDVWPQGRGCPACDGTGFMSDEDVDKLRAMGYRVPFSEFPTPTPADPE